MLQCSIDALLERTIKHMLFLQSVTKHADKLKQTGETKVWVYGHTKKHSFAMCTILKWVHA